jgi:hypothetical protein
MEQELAETVLTLKKQESAFEKASVKLTAFSEKAKALIGHVPGDEIELPGDEAHSTRRVRVGVIRSYN